MDSVSRAVLPDISRASCRQSRMGRNWRATRCLVRKQAVAVSAERGEDGKGRRVPGVGESRSFELGFDRAVRAELQSLGRDAHAGQALEPDVHPRAFGQDVQVERIDGHVDFADQRFPRRLARERGGEVEAVADLEEPSHRVHFSRAVEVGAKEIVGRVGGTPRGERGELDLGEAVRRHHRSRRHLHPPQHEVRGRILSDQPRPARCRPPPPALRRSRRPFPRPAPVPAAVCAPRIVSKNA